MKRHARLVILAAAAGAVGSCVPPEPGGERMDFVEFVSDVIADTSEDGEPVDLEGLEFQASEDETAFDGLLDDDE